MLLLLEGFAEMVPSPQWGPADPVVESFEILTARSADSDTRPEEVAQVLG